MPVDEVDQDVTVCINQCTRSALEPHYVSIRYEIIGLFKVSPTFTERNKICFTTFEYKRKILVYVYDALCDLILYPWQE